MITNIESVQVFPGVATKLYVSNSFSSSANSAPIFHYELQDSDGNILKHDGVRMTLEQWNSWDSNLNDEEYILACVAENLDVTIVE